MRYTDQTVALQGHSRFTAEPHHGGSRYVRCRLRVALVETHMVWGVKHSTVAYFDYELNIDQRAKRLFEDGWPLEVLREMMHRCMSGQVRPHTATDARH